MCELKVEPNLLIRSVERVPGGRRKKARFGVVIRVCDVTPKPKINGS